MRRYFYFAILSLVFNAQCFALQTIYEKNAQLTEAFNKNRQSPVVLQCSQSIEDTFKNEDKVIDRLAVEPERKIMITAIFSSVLTRELLEQSNYPDFTVPNVKNQRYAGHFKAVEALYKLARGLSGQFREGGYKALNLNNLLKNPNKMQDWIGLTADTFLGWFCESIETLYDELSYFDHTPSSFSGKIDRKWFEEIQNQYKNKEVSPVAYKQRAGKKGPTYTQILDNKGTPIAILKPTKTEGLRDGGDRRTEQEGLTSLLAKIMRLSKVFNRVIPVRIENNELFFDPINPTGTVERFLGFSKEACSEQTDDFSELVRNACTHDSTKPEKAAAKTFVLTHEGIVKTLLKKEIDHTLYQRSVACYTHDNTIDRFDLLKIFVLWHLTHFRDLHDNNIALVPDFEAKKLTPVVLDAERTWDASICDINYPWVYKADQAQKPFDLKDMSDIIGRASRDRIGNIFTAFSPSLRGQKSNFEKRFRDLETLFNPDKTTDAPANKTSEVFKIFDVPENSPGNSFPAIGSDTKSLDSTVGATISQMMNQIVYGKNPLHLEDKRRFIQPYHPGYKFFNCTWGLPKTFAELTEEKPYADIHLPHDLAPESISDSSREGQLHVPKFSLTNVYQKLE